MSHGFPPVPLKARRIAAALAGQDIGGEVLVFEELGSTSDHARELGLAGHPHGTVVFAEHQTAGRGRRENQWTAQSHRNLLLSLLLRPTVPMELWPRVTTLAALALCRAIESQTALHPAIKWPNDIYLGGKKCAGILAETFHGPHGAFLVLGMGMNVNETGFDSALRETATSLRIASAASTDMDRDALAINLLKQMGLTLNQLDSGFPLALEDVRRRSWLLGKRVMAKVDTRWIEGEAIALDEEGHLLLREPGGALLTLTSAEQVRPVK